MKISFCTTCKDDLGQDVRLGHLKRTIIQNIADNPDTADVQVEFIVLNYGDQGGLHDWMMTDPTIQSEIHSGRLIYAHTNDLKVPGKFHHAHAKNMAHRLATGDVVCNVDADNYTGYGFAFRVADLFGQNINSVICPAKFLTKDKESLASGFYGRIALSRENFNRLGGYDETFNTDGKWGGEDTDLLRRARMACLDYVEFDDRDFIQAIPHDNSLRVPETIKDVHAFTRALAQIEKTSSLPQTSLQKLPHRLRTVFTRAHVPFRLSLTANQGRNFGMGSATIYEREKTREVCLRPIYSGIKPFYNSHEGVENLVRTKFSPSVISLKDLGGGPS